MACKDLLAQSTYIFSDEDRLALHMGTGKHDGILLTARRAPLLEHSAKVLIKENGVCNR